MERFAVRRIGAEEVSELEAFAIVLAEHEDGTGQHLELKRALSFDEQDHRTGMATYCVGTSKGATHYGGVVACRLDKQTLTLNMDETAEKALGTPGFELQLEVDPASVERLRQGLLRVFPDGDRPWMVVA